MHIEFLDADDIFPVFESEALAVDLIGKLAHLADENQRNTEALGQRSPKDEAAGFNRCNIIKLVGTRSLASSSMLARNALLSFKIPVMS